MPAAKFAKAEFNQPRDYCFDHRRLMPINRRSPGNFHRLDSWFGHSRDVQRPVQQHRLPGREIAINAARIESFDEMESVGRIYLGSVATKTIRDLDTPEKTFAFARTNLEACLNCPKCDLVEWNETHAALFENLSRFEFLSENHMAVTVASRCES